MPTRIIRAAVAGADWGAFHARAFSESEHAQLVAVWSRSDKPSAKALAAKYGVPFYTDYSAMLAQVKPDVVSIATPERAHAPMTLEALDAGCHVYCEKVIADTHKAAAEMVRRAKQRKRKLHIGYNYRYSASCQYLTKQVKAGVLGPLLFAQLRAFTWCVHHMTDYAGSLLGTPTRAVAVFDRDPLPGRPLKSADALAFPTFVYAAFRRKAYMVEYDSGALLQAAATDYASIEEPGATFILQGADGRAELDDLSGNVTIRKHGREAIVWTPSQICDKIGLVENCVLCVKDFARAVASGAPAPIPGEQGLAMLCLEEAIFKSAKTGKWQDVKLPV